jgi:2'-5' RNA ligase
VNYGIKTCGSAAGVIPSIERESETAMPRLFTALRLPPEISLRLEDLRGGLSGARWIDPENYHITLNFFGNVDRHTANDLDAALASIDRAEFELTIDRLDVFGNSKPHALFAAISPTPALMELQAEISWIAKRLSIQPDKRKFIPHVTLARLNGTSAFEAAKYLALRGGHTSAPFDVSEFQLLSSKASMGGCPYITERHYPFRSYEGLWDIAAEARHWS